MTFELPENEKLSPWWRYAVVIVMVAGFTILGMVTSIAYDNVPPIPEKTVSPSSAVLFTKEEVMKGQEVFLKKNLMEHGTLWGHGAYLGPDYSALYLHEATKTVQDALAKKRYRKDYASLSGSEKRTLDETLPAIFKVNRYDASSEVLTFTEEETEAYQKAQSFWSDYFTSGKAPGLPPNFISNSQDLKALTSFFAWASWASTANRPGEDFSYTNNFPYDPVAGNFPSTDAYFWSAISLIFLLGATGLVLFYFGKFWFLGWGSGGHQEPRHVHETHLTIRGLTPSQKATGLYFVVVALLFLLQAFAGGALAHYRVEETFYGLALSHILPYNLLRTWHLQLAIFWIATAWLGGGLFVAPLISRHEPNHQKLGVSLLLGALVIVVLGSLAGEFLSHLEALPGTLWFWFGNQGSEYLDLGRFWQYLLLAGFAFWLFLLYRAIKPAFQDARKRELSFLFFLAAAAIPVFYTPALFYDHQTHYTLIDNWRFWIIHLWVEGFFEVFATVLVAVIFVQMGITRPINALRIIYLDAILYLGAGVVGTGHHWYFTGQTNVNMALSACFSAMEVVPLTLLTLDAWDFVSVTRRKCVRCGHYLAAKQTWTIYYLISVGVWNFIGAGIFGFLINLPIISYFEIGTNLTPNHGHAAMFGVFGMLAIGVMLFCTRAQQSEELWNRTKGLIKTGFWGLNGGMALMLLVDLFPAGVLQLWDSMKHGYWHARELSFLMSGTFHTLEWIRIIGDMTFILAGVIPTVAAVLITFLSKESHNIHQEA